jgi:F-type H+-transporting ATPase subunit b
MQLFNNLGIDWHLLIAQIINFLLLLFILNKYLYKPVIRRIEKDEEKIKDVEKEKEKLEAEKEKLQKQNAEVLINAKLQSQDIINEATRIAAEIRKKAELKGEEEIKKVISQFSSQIENQIKTKNILENKRKHDQYLIAISNTLNETFDDERKIDIQSMFFANLLDAVKNTEFNLSQNSFPLKLEFFKELDDKQQKELQKILSQKLQLEKITIDYVRNDRLFYGVRLEAAGLLFTYDLKEELQKTLEHSE